MVHQKKKQKLFFTSLVVVGLGVLAQQVLFPSFSPLDMLSSAISYPMLVAQRAVVVPVQQFFQRMKKSDELAERCKVIEQQNLDLMAENIKLRASLNYYSTIAQVADFTQRYTHKKVLIAQVLIKNMGPDMHKYILDKGSQHGVQKDMVALYKNCLLGKITQVYPLQSELTLITDASCRVSAVCAETKTAGIHVGTNQTATTALQRVSHLAVVQAGEMVLSSGEGLVFPQGFALGRIKVITPDALYTKIELEPLVDFASIAYCMLIKKGECDTAPVLVTSHLP